MWAWSLCDHPDALLADNTGQPPITTVTEGTAPRRHLVRQTVVGGATQHG